MIEGIVSSTLRRLGVPSLKVSVRERAMLILLFASGAVFAAVSALEWSESLRISAMETNSARTAYEQQIQRQAPGLTSQIIVREAEKARRMAFTASTIPIARAAGQASLERLANQAGIVNARVVPEGEVAGEGALKTQVYALQGAFDWPSFLALVEAISASPQSIAVLSVSVDGGMTSTFALRVRAPLVTDRTG